MTTDAPREPRLLIGIGFMMLAATVLPVMNGIVQWLSPRYASEQIIWARITGQFLIMLVLMLPAAGLQVFATRRPGLQVGRSLCQFASTMFYFTAIATVPLAKATAIGFLAPFIVALIAWPMLGERPKLRRVLAVIAAFIGVLVVIRPGGASFQPATLLILGSASAYALYQVLTRMVAGHDKAETSVLWSALIGAVVLTLALPFFWVTPHSLGDALGFVAVGLLGAAAHYCVARAFGYGPASVISPFQYWQILGAVAAGMVVQGVLPDGGTWLGAAIIVGAGVFLAVSEGRRR
jgi:drug/metabolite transporter (DMT)-like permease